MRAIARLHLVWHGIADAPSQPASKITPGRIARYDNPDEPDTSGDGRPEERDPFAWLGRDEAEPQAGTKGDQHERQGRGEDRAGDDRGPIDVASFVVMFDDRARCGRCGGGRAS